MAIHLFVFATLLGYLVAAEKGASDITVVVANKDSDHAASMYRLNLTSETFQLVDTLKLVRPTAFAFDDVTGRIFWSDVVTKEIRSSQLDGSDEQSFVNLSTESIVDGIAIDSIERELFYTDRGNNIVASVSIDGPNFETIIQEVDSLPRAITVFNKRRLLFWTHWGPNAAIYGCSYSGDNKTTIVETNIKWPNGLTIDTQSERLYWVDAFYKSLDGIDIDGTDRRRMSGVGYYYYGIVFFEGALYTTDWDSNAVKVTAVNGTELASLTYTGFSKLSGLAVFRVSREECPDGYYGLGCLYECGQCSDSEVCRKTDGTCPSGCINGWYSERCDQPDLTILNSGTSLQGHLAFMLISLAVVLLR